MLATKNKFSIDNLQNLSINVTMSWHHLRATRLTYKAQLCYIQGKAINSHHLPEILKRLAILNKVDAGRYFSKITPNDSPSFLLFSKRWLLAMGIMGSVYSELSWGIDDTLTNMLATSTTVWWTWLLTVGRTHRETKMQHTTMRSRYTEAVLTFDHIICFYFKAKSITLNP